MADQVERRELKFEQLSDIVRDAESLRASGYQRAGQWDLGQVCGHLTEWIRYPVEGFPRPPVPFRVLFWAVRKTIGPSQLRRTLETGTIPNGAPTLRQTIPPSDGDEAEAISKLREALGVFEAHTGPFHPSPLFGKMDRDQLTRLHLIHSAHHLSFLRGNDNAEPPRDLPTASE